MTVPLRRLARLATTRSGAVAPSAPFAVRGKATQSARRAAGTLSSDYETHGNNDTALPFYVSWIGNLLGASLNETQLEAFGAKYLRTVTGNARSAPTETAPDVSSALDVARRERDAAVSRANAVDAEALTLRLRLAQTDASALERLRAELKATQLEAAEARIALNALKFARSPTVTDTDSSRDSTHVRQDVQKITARESELKLAVQTLEKELAAAFERVKTAENASASFAASVVRDHQARNDTEFAKLQPAVHPVFGHLLRDFGYKRVYAMRAGCLTDKTAVQVYEQQRAFRSERAVTIASQKARDKFSVPGVISLAEGTARAKTVPDPDGSPAPVEALRSRRSVLETFFSAPERSVTILDGQHRVGALEILLKNGVLAPSDEILVEVFPDVCEEKAVALFTEINRAQPVRFIDLPGSMSVDAKRALDGAASFFAKKYPSMFSESARCKLPNLNVDALREQLHDAEVGARYGLKTERDFVTWMRAENQKLSERSEKRWLELRPKRGRGSSGSEERYLKALAKAKEHGFYLGMCETWLDVK